MIWDKMFQFELHPQTGEIRTEILVYEKGGVIKHVKAPAIKKVELLDLWKNGRCGIGLNILLPTEVPVVCLSYCRPHGLEYHYDITVSDHTKCVIPHRHSFGLLSHHVRLGARGFRRKLPLDGATDLLSKIWQHITTVSFVSAFIVVYSRKPKKRLWTCLNGAKK